MIHHKMSAEELDKIKIEGIAARDKDLINECVGAMTGEGDTVKANAIRGYLVQLSEECVIDDEFREELSSNAAAFSDGWDWAIDFSNVPQ